MTMKKLTRVAVVAFALAVLLAVSSFAAYTLNLDGTVNGLADGVDYTAAQYDFANDAWGEDAALTASTQLTPGVWGIKAGEADAEIIFVSGGENGKITFWNTETNLPAYNFAGVNDNIVPGKWSVSSNGAFRTVQAYNGANEASACLYLVKSKYLTQVESTTQKTVTVEEVSYPVYSIDGAEYYLKDDVYYATADNSAYEGEGEAAAVYTLTWKNATPIVDAEGENNNKLQESSVKYGFTNEQIVPAKDVNAIKNAWIAITTGGNRVNTEKYTKADVKGTFTFFVKVPGVEGYETYVVDIDEATIGRSIAAPAAMAESEGYLVGFEFAPYANCPDDIFYGNASDGAGECYAHYGLYKGANTIDYTAELLPGPTGLVNGFGTIGGLDADKTYEIASATISEDGKSILCGEWTAFDPDDRSLVGLYAVREVYGDRATDVTYAYSYGSYEERAEIGALGGSNGTTVLVTGGSKFLPGQYSGSYTSYYTQTLWEIMSHGQVDASLMKPSYDAKAAYDALVSGGTATEEELAAAKATLDTANAAVINKLKSIVLRYTYAPKEIVPVGDVNSFNITAKQNNGGFTMSGNQNKRVVAYVADSTGKITTYETIISQAFSTSLNFTIDFASFLPEEGYLVAFEVYLVDNVSADNFIKVTNQYSFRYYTKVLPTSYSIDKPADLPFTGDKPAGLIVDVVNGIVSGLDSAKRYQYALFNINGIAADGWTLAPVGATSIELGDTEGLVAIALVGDGYTTAGSLPTYIYLPGGSYNNILHTTEIVGNGGTYNGVTINVPVVKDSGNVSTPAFTDGTWMGIYVTNALAKTYGYAPLAMGTTSTPVATSLGKAIKSAQEAYDALVATGTATEEELAAALAKLESARQAAADRNAQIFYSYAYEADEIIPMEDFVSYKFAPRVRQTGLKVASGQVYTKFIFKVVDENDQLVDRVVLKPVTFGYNESVTVTKEDFDDTTGYIVGIVIYPFGVIDGYYAYNSDTNGDYMVVLFEDGYTVEERVLEPAEMTKLTETDGVVTGFDASYTYEYAAYAMNGAIGEWTAIEGDSFTLENVGLTAIRIKSNNKTYESSAPQIFYKAGLASARKAISETNAEGALVYQNVTDFVVGTYTGTRISYMNDSLVAKTGAHIHLDQQVGGLNSPDEAELLWLYARTKEEAQAALDAEAAKESEYKTDNSAYYPERLQGVIDSFYGVEGKDYEADYKALRESIAETYKGSYVRYAYTADEIVPVDELESITFYNKQRQGSIRFYAKSAANFYVMDENGVVTPYQWKSGYFHSYQYSEYTQTVDVQNEVDLPENGWIVAIEYIPFAEVAADTVTAVCYTKLAYKAQAYAFEQNHVNMGFYYDNYTIEYPTLEKPANVEFADGKFAGLDADVTYAYGRFTADGIETTEITGVTEVAVDGVGVWGIKVVSTDSEYEDSLYVVGYNKDLTTARDNIIHTKEATKSNGTVINVPIVASAGTYSATAAPVFNEGTWTGFSLSNSLAVNHGYTAMTLGTTSCTVPGSGPAASIKAAASDAALEAARDFAADALATVYYSYEYYPEEVIPMNEFISWSFKSAERQGSLIVEEGSLQTKFVFKVATENGVVDRAVYKDAALNGSGTAITISIDDFAETDGYIVGIIIYPYGNCPEGTVIGSDKDVYNNVPISEDILVVLNDDYTVYPAVITAAEAPVLTIGTTNADIVVTNYMTGLDYAYSCDGGETWVAFTGKSFRATKASTEYIVKSLANEFYEESAVSEAVVSPALTLVGTSLVLDGQIGLKVYMDIDMDLVSSALYYTTKVNSDYAGNTDMASLYRQGDYVSLVRGNKWMTQIQLDEETGYYYTIIYVPAKDIDNTNFEAALNIYLKSAPETKVLVSNIGFRFSTYIDQAKALAAAGDAEFVKALPLVEALETYTAYADNYFGNGEDAAYASTASTEGVEVATRTNATLEGVAFYGTSLILEDQVTIRHYFTVEDIDAFNAAYTCDIAYGTKGNYIYFDITDISAQFIGDTQTLTIKDAEGNVAYEVNYSVANYIVNMMNDNDANLVSLVNAMYDYYLAAVEYSK